MERLPNSGSAVLRAKRFFVSLFGYSIASAFWTCWRIFVLDEHSKWVSDGMLIAANLLGSAFWGVLFLLLPLLASFALNKEIADSCRNEPATVRSLLLGVFGGFCMGWLLISEGKHKVLTFSLLYLVFFATALFTFARRPDGEWVIFPMVKNAARD